MQTGLRCFEQALALDPQYASAHAGIATAVRPVVIPANQELGMLGRVCVPLMVRGFRVGYLWVQQDSAEENPTAILTQLPDVAPQVERLSGLLLESNTAESEFRRGRERAFLAACSGEANAVAAVAGSRTVAVPGVGAGPAWSTITPAVQAERRRPHGAVTPLGSPSIASCTSPVKPERR